MTDTAPILIWMSGPDGRWVYLNRTWTSFTGRGPEEELAMGWIETVHEEDRCRVLEKYEVAVRNRERWNLEFRLRRSDGEFRWLLCTGEPRFSGEGVFLGQVGTCVDITERKQGEEMRREILEDLEVLVHERTANLKMANRHLRREVAARKRLEKRIVEISDHEKQRIGIDLHDDLGQQLTGVAFLSKLLEHKLTANRRPERSDASRIHDLVNQALSYTRELARGLHVVELKAGGLVSALREFRTQVESLFSISCDVQCARRLCVEDAATANHLFRIVQEAVSNAIKHGSAKCVRISLATEKQRGVLTVKDDGIGCPPTRGGQAGLGLHTMRYRTEMIRGSFRIRRAPEGGTEVVCSFPLKPNKNTYGQTNSTG